MLRSGTAAQRPLYPHLLRHKRGAVRVQAVMADRGLFAGGNCEHRATLRSEQMSEIAVNDEVNLMVESACALRAGPLRVGFTRVAIDGRWAGTSHAARAHSPQWPHGFKTLRHIANVESIYIANEKLRS